MMLLQMAKPGGNNIIYALFLPQAVQVAVLAGADLFIGHREEGAGFVTRF
jgi:hypothetical protein